MIKISDIINLHQLYELNIEGGTIPVSVLKFSAQEELSQPFQFTIEFTSLVKDIGRADILNK